ncbi:MAG TPA: methyltransferase domain-containing protein [Burkholderiales bacterium]|nr:methyltransferase domain-containing protein [Burkholderiales bacterium]
MNEPIRFDDGAAYERFMGAWSRLVGDVFIDWLSPAKGQRWVDVGCGNGAFTEAIIERCAPSAISGVDPSQGQLDFARARPGTRMARFDQGDAMALPYADRSFDVAVMALVIFFVPDPARGVAEMGRVVRPGGMVAAYAWDMPGGGFPMRALQEELLAMGIEAPRPPSFDASRIDAMESLWKGAGLSAVATRQIRVQRTFSDFEELWNTSQLSPSTGPRLRAMPDRDRTVLKERLRGRFTPGAGGSITVNAHANAVRGEVPA